MTTAPASGITIPWSPHSRSYAMPRVLIVLLGLAATAALAQAADDRPVREKVRDVERHMKQIIDDAEASVVAISVSHSTRYPGKIDPANPGKLGDYATPRGGPGGGAFDTKLDLGDLSNVADHPFGSGVVLDEDGLILTNYHLVEGARKIYVRGARGLGSYANVHAADARSDLAVLKLLRPLPDLKPMAIAAGRLVAGPKGEKPTIARGMWVVALGHPDAAGFPDGIPSASWGILSGVRRRTQIGSLDTGRNTPLTQLSSLLQTDARLTLGSSGAPLVNLDGEMIGLSTPAAAITGAETAGGYAIPMDPNFRRIVAALKEGREVEYGFLGVSFLPPGPGSRRLENGLAILDVSPGSPAEKSGLSGGGGGGRRGGFDTGQGDTILAVDGQPLREQDDLYLQVGAALAGSRVKLTVERQGVRRTVEVSLAKTGHDLPFIASVRPAAAFGLRVDWSSTIQAKAGGGIPMPECVSVRDLEPGSAAAQRFKEIDPESKGTWLVLAVDGEAATTPARFSALTAGKASVTLRCVNLGDPERTRDVTLP